MTFYRKQCTPFPLQIDFLRCFFFFLSHLFSSSVLSRPPIWETINVTRYFDCHLLSVIFSLSTYTEAHSTDILSYLHTVYIYKTKNNGPNSLWSVVRNGFSINESCFLRHLPSPRPQTNNSLQFYVRL